MESEAANGLYAAVIAVLVVAGRQLVEVLAKKIPDSATGWKAAIRMIAKVAAGYTKNKE